MYPLIRFDVKASMVCLCLSRDFLLGIVFREAFSELTHFSRSNFRLTQNKQKIRKNSIIHFMRKKSNFLTVMFYYRQDQSDNKKKTKIDKITIYYNFVWMACRLCYIEIGELYVTKSVDLFYSFFLICKSYDFFFLFMTARKFITLFTHNICVFILCSPISLTFFYLDDYIYCRRLLC